MIKLIVTVLLVIISFPVLGQTGHDWQPDTSKAYGKEYTKPYFRSGDSALNNFIRTHLRYPDAAREENVTGRVIVRFLVDEQGGILRVKVMRGIGSGCDEAAVRVIKAMPLWMPAIYKKRPVRAVETMPIKFYLE